MKITYKIAISILLILLVVWIFLISIPIGEKIQGVSAIVALLAAVIALSVADPSKKDIKVEVYPEVDNLDLKELKSNLPQSIPDQYKEGSESFIKCYRVSFKITNKSDFSLKNTILRFKLPFAKQPLNKTDNGYEISYHSNFLNPSWKPGLLVSEPEGIIEFFNNTPFYFNEDEYRVVWFTMFFGDMEKFTIDLCINCDNANGIINKLEIDPQKLLDNFKKKPE